MVRWTEGELKLHQAKRGTPSASKYKNVKTEIDGQVFDSKREAARWTELTALEIAGRIEKLRRQVPFALVVNRQSVGNYVADFVYFRNGKEVVEDSKGMKTDIYKLKKKLMSAIHGIDIEES